jgi:hypothetical protein
MPSKCWPEALAFQQPRNERRVDAATATWEYLIVTSAKGPGGPPLFHRGLLPISATYVTEILLRSAGLTANCFIAARRPRRQCQWLAPATGLTTPNEGTIRHGYSIDTTTPLRDCR